MNSSRIGPALALAALSWVAAGCSSGAENPAKLWLYLDGAETEVKLVPYEPEPF